ncbi:Os07g0556132 [Oryza sativa Japonica Group]|uniref:Os07g0556132 protein n=1 Tax=Oryza sativa subsp. japonica TaxID=39947 RepID=A0A0P0X7Q8_ORYSJ|nr:Os07g0556132 [Oryza sativa Japonica Group]
MAGWSATPAERKRSPRRGQRERSLMRSNTQRSVSVFPAAGRGSARSQPEQGPSPSPSFLFPSMTASPTTGLPVPSPASPGGDRASGFAARWRWRGASRGANGREEERLQPAGAGAFLFPSFSSFLSMTSSPPSASPPPRWVEAE